MASDAPTRWARRSHAFRLLAVLGTAPTSSCITLEAAPGRRAGLLSRSLLETAEVEAAEVPPMSSAVSSLEALTARGCLQARGMTELALDQYCFMQTSKEKCSNTYATKDAISAFRCFWDDAGKTCNSEERHVCNGTLPESSRMGSLSYSNDFNDVNMQWLGKDWFANGIQDWRIDGGRIECITNVPFSSGRTAHLLTQRVPGGRDPVGISFRLDLTNPNGTKDNITRGLPRKAFGGVLVGIGDEDADYRQSALVQMLPAEGGGILVGVDGEGQVGVRRFKSNWAPDNLWHSCHYGGGGYEYQGLPQIADCPINTKLTPDLFPVNFRLSYMPDEAFKVVVLHRNGTRLVTCVAHKLWRKELKGKISLFSAHGLENTTTGFAFDDLQLTGFEHVPEHAYGPVLGVLYNQATYGSSPDGLTGDDVHELRMTVQLPVLGAGRKMNLELEIEDDDGHFYKVPGVFHGDDDDMSWTMRYNVTSSKPLFLEDHKYRLLEDHKEVYSGIIRREKSKDENTVLASLSCNKNAYGELTWNNKGMWFPFSNVTMGLQAHDPDVLFFAGDQVYNGDLTPPDSRSQWHALMDYHYKWQRFLWSFGDITKDRPTVVTPDDHDMYQGNLWGGGGHTNVHDEEGFHNNRLATVEGLDDVEGYWWGAKFVNAVIGTQSSNLPPTRVTKLIGNEGILTYTTSWRHGGLDFAVLADRMWKSAPRAGETDKTPLLGPEQEKFLELWSQSKPSDAWTKVALSQSPFASLFTGFFDIPKYGEDAKAKASHPHKSKSRDSNGYPPAGRHRAVKLLQEAGALHLTGDQHLGLVVQYGADEWGDGTVVFSSPAVACAYPRFWLPPAPGLERWNGSTDYMGHYQDGYANKFTIMAVSNPVAQHPDRAGLPYKFAEKSPGYGIVRFHSNTDTVALENWPPWANPCKHGEMYEDWPIMVNAQAKPKVMGKHVPEDVYGDLYARCESRWAHARDPQRHEWRRSMPVDARDSHFDKREAHLLAAAKASAAGAPAATSSEGSASPGGGASPPDHQAEAAPGTTTAPITGIGVELVSNDHGCASQAYNFGMFTTPDDCAQFVTLVPECSYRFMFSPDRPEFGCRCCADSASGLEKKAMTEWSLYEISLVTGEVAAENGAAAPTASEGDSASRAATEKACLRQGDKVMIAPGSRFDGPLDDQAAKTCATLTRTFCAGDGYRKLKFEDTDASELTVEREDLTLCEEQA
jgi:alkaline phosphatase D